MQEAFEVQAASELTLDIVDEPVVPVDGYVRVPTCPGLGLDLDWDRLAGHPYERANLLRLFSPGWERRGEERRDPQGARPRVPPGGDGVLLDHRCPLRPRMDVSYTAP